jgi:hypothetical protein
MMEARIDPHSIHKEFVVTKPALGQIYLQVLRPGSIIPPMFQIHVHLSSIDGEEAW